MTDTAAEPLLLRRSQPADVGIDAAAGCAFLDAIEAGGLDLHSLMVVRHGAVAVEGWWAPYSAGRVHLLYSLSKSFTSSAVGLCVAEGRFALDDRIVDLLPERTPADVEKSVAELTVRHLLSMSTGHREDVLGRALLIEPHDAVRGFLRLPPEEPLGSMHAYNNATTFVLAALVEKASSLPLLDYLRPRLLDPLGIRSAHWDCDEHGQAMGFSGLHLQTESVAAFGQLLLQDGVWRGERLLPEGWVALATQKHIDSGGQSPDWQQGYGYQFWMATHGYRGDGAFGQFCLVLPELDLVVVTTAATLDMQGILDAVWAHLLPAIAPDGSTISEAAVQAELATRCRALELTTGGSGGVFLSARPGDFVVVESGPDAPFAAGTRVTVTPDGDNVVVSVELSDSTLTFGCGRRDWVEGALVGPGSRATAASAHGRAPLHTGDSVPVVCRGGWTGAGTFEADLILIETPHRVRMRGNGSELVATWNIPPLTGSRIESQLPGAVWALS